MTRALHSILAFAFWSLIFGIVPAWPQAALLPNANQTFLDANGNPLSNGKVFMSVPNTTVPKTTWSDAAESAPNTNPVQLDAAGRAVIYGQGSYQQKVLDSLNNQQWNALTTAYNSSPPTGATGTDTAPVGTVMPFSGFVAPTNWAFAYGETFSRVSFPDLLTALTISTATASCTNSSPTISGFTDTSQMPVGAPIEATCLPPSTTVSAIVNGTTITASANASVTATVTATVFPWGDGDQSSTFNVPDLRGRTIAGADAMGGTAANRLTSTFFGASAAVPAEAGGSQSHTLTQAELSVALGTATSVVTEGQTASAVVVPGGATQVGVGSPPDINPVGAQVAITGTSVATTITNSAGGNAHAIVQPTLTVNYIIKLKPNTTGAGGVVSIGGMFGDILCGANLTCVNGTVSATGTLSTPLSLNHIFVGNVSGVATDVPMSGVLGIDSTGLTAFTSFAFTAPSTLIGLSPVTGTGLLPMRADAAPALSQAISPIMTGNWTFNPTSTVLPIFLGNQSLTSTAAHGLAFNQAGAFTTTSTFSYNTIEIQTNAVVNSPGVSARGFDVGVQVGASAKGSVVGVNAEADQLTASVTTGGDIVGVVGTAFATQPNGGTDPVSDAHGTLFGSSLIGIAANGATAYQIVTGSELQAIIQTGGTAQIRFAASIAGNGSVRGSTYDAGIGFYNYSSGGGFLNAILLTNILTNPPLATSGCLICTDGSSDTIATGIDLSAYTISGNFLKGPGGAFQVTGAGAVKGTGYTVGSTAGATCTLTTVSHLTVVNGIVTLCN